MNEPILTFSNVDVAFSSKRLNRNSAPDTDMKIHAVTGASGSLAAGEVISLIGPNGSGKTTLLRALLGHIRAAGSIAWQSTSIDQISSKSLAKLVAYLPQISNFESTQTVFETLMLGRAPHHRLFEFESVEDESIALQIARELEIDSLLARPLHTLSGGQRQRVFVGRSLVQQPAALLLDEPATYLDLRHQLELHKLLRHLATDRRLAVMVASHDINLAGRFSDKLMLMNQGHVVASGSASQVLTTDLIGAVYQTPMTSVMTDDGVNILVAR